MYINSVGHVLKFPIDPSNCSVQNMDVSQDGIWNDPTVVRSPLPGSVLTQVLKYKYHGYK